MNAKVTATSGRNHLKSGGEPEHVYAREGDTPESVSQRYGVEASALRAANPDMGPRLSAGQRVQLPSQDEANVDAAAAGAAGASGREAAVHRLMERAYRAGMLAPQGAFNDTVYRAVPSKYADGLLDHRHGVNPDRYKGPGEGRIYTSPSEKIAVAEVKEYATADELEKAKKTGYQPWMANKTVTALQLEATPNASGRGGVADLHEGLRQVGLPATALTEPKGNKLPGLLNRVTGEHPYTLAQQAAKGASDAGAAAIRAPGPTGHDQINVIPRNIDPSQVRPLKRQPYDLHGRPMGWGDVSKVQAMPADTRPYVEGPIARPAGGDLEHQGPESLPLSEAEQKFTRSQDGYPRASSVRYGAAGGAAGALINAGADLADGKPVNAGAVISDVGVQGGVGATAAKASDALSPKIGIAKAGGAVGAVIEGGISAYDNIEAYKKGEIDGSHAAANVAVDTGTAFAAGAAGAAAGAAVGSVVPVAGTAVGAVAGFVVGAGVHYAIDVLGEKTGATEAVKEHVASAIDTAADVGGDAVDVLEDAGKATLDAVKFW